MKTTYRLLLSLLVISLFSIACSTDDEQFVSIEGTVSDDQTGNVISNATVQISAPQEFSNVFARTDESGKYIIGDLEIKELTDLTLSASATDYQSRSKELKVVEGDEVTNFDFNLRKPSDDDGGDDDGEGVSGPSEGAAAIILAGISNPSINIAETGGIVNTSFTFQVQDSSGRSLDLNNAEEVTFSILSGPGGGEGITPLTAVTNNNGRVTSNLYSGNIAGVVQIQAEIVREDVGLTIRSKPVAVTIHGGFPDLDHFSIAANRYNFEGWSINGNRNQLTVILGDKFGNPVKPGTAVYFTTTGGIIQGSGQGNTNADGQVSVDLISGDPRPNDPIPGSDGRPGFATVTAKTVNGDNEEIDKSVIILFSSSRALVSASPTTFDLAPNGGESFDFTVTDVNGNPMPAGTSITVEAGEGMEVTGSNEITLGNNYFPGPGSTDFKFSIRDTDDQSNDEASLTIKITVQTPSGETTVYDQISGIRRKSP